MGHYVAAKLELASLKKNTLSMLIVPFRVQPAPRPKGALTEGISGLWITRGKHVYRVTEPQARNLEDACPIGRSGEVVHVKERLTHITGSGWCYAIDNRPVTLPMSDPRVTEMIGWAHHRDSTSCPAHQMPAFAARYFLKITKVSALHPTTEGPWQWNIYVEPTTAGGSS